MLLFSSSVFGEDRSNKSTYSLEVEKSEDSSYGKAMIAVNDRSLQKEKDEKKDTNKKVNKDTKTKKSKKETNLNIIIDGSGLSCTSDLFVGTWDYAEGCDGSAYRAVISCDDPNIDMCTYSGKTSFREHRC